MLGPLEVIINLNSLPHPPQYPLNRHSVTHQLTIPKLFSFHEALVRLALVWIGTVATGREWKFPKVPLHIPHGLPPEPKVSAMISCGKPLEGEILRPYFTDIGELNYFTDIGELDLLGLGFWYAFSCLGRACWTGFPGVVRLKINSPISVN